MNEYSYFSYQAFIMVFNCSVHSSCQDRRFTFYSIILEKAQVELRLSWGLCRKEYLFLGLKPYRVPLVGWLWLSWFIGGR